jgi:protein-disulfide isomerase
VQKVILALSCLSLVAAGACKEKTTSAGGSDPGAVAALERAGSGSGDVKPVDDTGPTDKTPLAGVDLGQLGADKQELFYKLIGSLPSPCGKAQSLRASFTSDQSCKRAPFAVRYVLALVGDEANESQIRDEFEKKYVTQPKLVKFDLSHEPHVGSEDAPIRLVEFYDYGCPHCEEFLPYLERVMQDEGNKVVVYFMHYNLGHFPNSQEAAQAALAAAAQGKFHEMHTLLFNNRTEHDPAKLDDYAKQIGLDMAKFKADYAAASGHVDQQKAQGEAAGVDSTPTLFFNDHKYEGPMHPKYIEMWIEEELAVNR